MLRVRGCAYNAGKEAMNAIEDRERVALANADYEDRRASDPSHSWNMRTVEREWKLKPGQLFNYRANKKRRKDNGVQATFERHNWPERKP